MTVWIPNHVAIEGNEKADQMATIGSNLPYITINYILSSLEATPIIKKKAEQNMMTQQALEVHKAWAWEGYDGINNCPSMLKKN